MLVCYNYFSKISDQDARYAIDAYKTMRGYLNILFSHKDSPVAAALVHDRKF